MKSFKSFISESDDDNNKIELAKKIISVGQKHHVERFVDHPNHFIRSQVARRGFKDHLDKLVNDKHPDVREAVASAGHDDHLDKLVNDQEPVVRDVVAARKRPQDLAKLMHDESPRVRSTVAFVADDNKIKEALSNDPSVSVRMNVAASSKDEDLLDRMAAVTDNSGVHSMLLSKPRQSRIIASNPDIKYDTKLKLATSRDPETVDNLIATNYHRSPGVLAHAAEHGSNRVREKLLNHPDINVMKGIINGTDKREHLEKFVDPKHENDLEYRIFVRAKALGFNDIATAAIRKTKNPRTLHSIAHHNEADKDDLYDILLNKHTLDDAKGIIALRGDDRHHEKMLNDSDDRYTHSSVLHSGRSSDRILGRLINSRHSKIAQLARDQLIDRYPFGMPNDVRDLLRQPRRRRQ